MPVLIVLFLLAGMVAAFLLHLGLGWQWTVLGGLIAGLSSSRWGALVGGFAVTLEWAALVLFNFAVAPAESARFVDIGSRLLGGMAPAMLVAATVALGGIVGLMGGAIGSRVRAIYEQRQTKQNYGRIGDHARD